MNIGFITRNSKTKINYNLVLVCVSFKLTNIFISLSNFIKFFQFFVLSKLLYTYSCGIVKNVKKTSAESYKSIISILKFFLLNNNIKKIHLICKSNKKLKTMFLNSLLHALYNCKQITIISVYLSLTIPFNGCKLQKHKFL